MSVSVLIEAVEAEGFGGGGMVAAAFGDVQAAGVFDGRDDGGADGGQVGGPAAGTAGRGVFAESHVPDVVVHPPGAGRMTDMTTDSPSGKAAERFEVQRQIAALPAVIFALLCDPQGHVAIDSSGMLQSAEGAPVRNVGDTFVVHMDREALNDYPMGKYDVTVIITRFQMDTEIEWTISA